MKRENAKKQNHGLVSNIIYNLLSAKKWDKGLFYYQLLLVFPQVGGAWLRVVLPAELVRGLEEKWEPARLGIWLLGLALGIWGSELLWKWMREYLYRNALSFHLYYEKCCFRKAMGMDYDSLEDPEKRKLMGNAWNVIRNEFVLRDAVMTLPGLLAGGLGSLFYGFLTGRESMFLLLLVLLNVLSNFALLRFTGKKYDQYHRNLSTYTAKTAYVSRQAMERSAGKEIRIYGMKKWFMDKFDENLKGMDHIHGRIHNWYFLRGSAEAVLTFFMEGAAYAYLIFLLAGGELSAAGFVLLMGLVRGFGGYFGQLVQRCLSLNSVGTAVGYIRAFLELPDTAWKSIGIGEARLEEVKKEAVKVELRHVSYTYPGEQRPTLEDINLVIRPGEKLALIGLNGAGKTTLVKLLSGFYRPTRGEILINDIPAEEFSREEYYSLVTVLFQDSTMLPMSLDRNLTSRGKEDTDRAHLRWTLDMAGFLEKYESLPERGDTLLVREANRGAADFSGGEKQKLLFARALYKKAPLLILDEPTAALDPIAENALYCKYGQAAEGRTSVYISHRLSSTRFCDRIILLSRGKILEEGTHEELMRREGRYARLYEVQSRYYQEEEKRKRRNRIMEDEDTEDGMAAEGKGTEGIFYEQRGY